MPPLVMPVARRRPTRTPEEVAARFELRSRLYYFDSHAVDICINIKPQLGEASVFQLMLTADAGGSMYYNFEGELSCKLDRAINVEALVARVVAVLEGGIDGPTAHVTVVARCRLHGTDMQTICDNSGDWRHLVGSCMTDFINLYIIADWTAPLPAK